MGATLGAALKYHDLGLVVFPLPYGEKSNGRRWGTYRYIPPDRREVMLMFNGHQNIGVICGAASGNLLALDCDAPQTYAEVAARLAGLGIETWTVRREPNGTPHDGGGTFLLRTPEAIATTSRPDLDIKAEGSYIVAPPSAHPGGTLYYDETPPPIYALPDLTALDWLELETAGPSHPYQRLPNLAYKLLRADAQTLARYPSRSEAEAALCASLVRSGREFDDALRLLRTYPGPGKFAELHAANPRNGLRYLGLTWHNAEAWIATHDNEAGLLARHMRQWALARPWRGRGASSDRAVYLAHLDIVERCGKDPHGASVRELAEMAGIGWKTASRANWRLVDAGLLKLVTPATPSCPHVWELLLPPNLDGGGLCIVTHSINTNVMECVTMHDASHDVFRWGGLNKSGAEVLTALQVMGEATVNELATTTGRHRTTVKRKLRQMTNLGLVEPLGDDYWRAVDAPDLDRAARELNTSGVGKRQRERHVRDRRTNRRVLARGRRRKD